MKNREVPAFLCVDVEPDGLEPARNSMAPWTGYDAAYKLLDRLRADLVQITGVAPRFTWFLRMDPQIAAIAPSADHVVSGYPDRIAQLKEAGDLFGLHIHPQRWSEERECWIHDYADRAWNRDCIESSMRAFERAFGAPATRHRYGGGYVHNDHVELLEQRGMLVDLTPERRFIPEDLRVHPRDFSGRSRGQRIGVLPDCSGIPRTAYRASHDDALVADDNGRNLVMIPLTATRARPHVPRWRRAASRVRHLMKPPSWRMLYPAGTWREPGLYWDLVERDVDSMRRPYAAVAIRTNAPGSREEENSRRVLEALPSHRLARRLRFIDPIEAAPSLLATRASLGLAWTGQHRPAAHGAARR